MNYLANKEGMLRAMTFFQDTHNKKAIFQNGDQIKPMASELYVNKLVSIAGGKQSLLQSGSDNVVGVTNFDGNKLDQGRAFALDGVSFHAAIGDKGAKPYNVDYATGITKAQAQAFQFANLVLRQNNEILMRLPISSILNGKQEFSEYRDLDLIMLIPQKVIEVELEFPDEVAAPSVGDGKAIFVSVKFRGYESYQRR
ncbi:conserved protein of unknown function [Tenacibaculum litopenaei]|uniref:hypothetical protein n=1 Tax=Tenacibaculum litopenaei TaxID=396016 RepID=UPI0038945232